MQPEVVFCNLASAKYQAELLALKTLIQSPLTLWQTTKGRLNHLNDVVYQSIYLLVGHYEKQFLEVAKIDTSYNSSSKPKLCILLFACTHLIDCILELPVFGLNNLPPATKTAIKTDFATFEQYVCNLKFVQILNGYSNKICEDLIAKLEVLKNQLVNGFEIDGYMQQYEDLLNSTTITLTGCNGNTYSILQYFEYIQALASEANQLCQECGVVVDDTELVSLGRKLSLAEQADGTWGVVMDTKIAELQTNVQGLIAHIDDLTARAGFGPGVESNGIPKDDLMK